jgi:hypothetical protein
MQEYTRGMARIIKAGNGRPSFEEYKSIAPWADVSVKYEHYASLCGKTLPIEKGIESYVPGGLDMLVGKDLLAFAELMPESEGTRQKWNFWWIKDGDKRYFNHDSFEGYRNARKIACSTGV